MVTLPSFLSDLFSQLLLSTNLSSSTVTSVRGQSFSNQEDQFMCLAWLEISQDPVLGTCQKKDKMWERITAVFHKKEGDRPQTPRSLECRMDTIKKLTQARIMYGEDVKERKGFQFDHVWTILKDAEKWADPKSNHAAAWSISEGSESNTQSRPNATEDIMDLNTESESFMNTRDGQSPTDSPASQPVGRKK
ncbi:uncharacterized protein LOC109821913 [Asparagus officinalis]|uniref:uncharacterized protein LOC109821913 n=1 Tax=Asparagus officinalis TaxID=4686 RepID=UPI00098E4925|nr:uncharacterized protein LOC109821913 [Asparagus officinalis]